MIDTYFPMKTTKIHSKDKPWVTPYFKDLINQRQSALHRNSDKYKNLRNKVNRERTKLRKQFFCNKIDQLTNNDPKQWWRHVKDVGLTKQENTSVLKGLANATSDGNMELLAENINIFFWSVSSDLPPLPKDNIYSKIDSSNVPDKFIIRVEQVKRNLSRIKLGKAPGPDGITSWMLRDLAPVLAPPITSLFNASIRDGFVPPAWKCANITPLPKKCPPQKIESDLRPVSLTSLLAKELERIIAPWIKDAIGENIGELQFGNAKGVSTTHMLVKMLDSWHKALDTPGTSVRVVLLDFPRLLIELTITYSWINFKS